MAESVSDETRERITAEAARAVRAAPVSALSVQQVARAAGVTSSSIYKAYSSKYELFAEASRRVLVEQVVAIAEGVDEAAPPLERLRQVLTGLFHVGRDEPFPAAYLYGMFPSCTTRRSTTPSRRRSTTSTPRSAVASVTGSSTPSTPVRSPVTPTSSSSCAPWRPSATWAWR
ncbi:MAG: TetR/AcrR family transcriptional regulator [Acidimicrobiales bacterium]